MKERTLIHKNALQLYRKKSVYKTSLIIITLLLVMAMYKIMYPYALKEYRYSIVISYVASFVISYALSRVYENLIYRELSLKSNKSTFLKIYTVTVTSAVMSVLSYFLQDVVVSVLFHEVVTTTSLFTSIALGLVAGFDAPIDCYLDIESMSEKERYHYFNSIIALEPSDIHYIANGLQRAIDDKELKDKLNDIISDNNEMIEFNVKYNNLNQFTHEFIREIGAC